MPSGPIVLLTGFEPFAESPENPSARVVARLAADPPPGMQLVGEVLPVVAAETGGALAALLDRIAPDVVMMLGEARGDPALRIERLAVNLVDFAVADNAGETIRDAPIVADGPAAYWTTLPVRAVQRAIRGIGVPCTLSLSAGSHMCNLVMYRALHWAAQRRSSDSAAGAMGPWVGFIHLPSLPVQMADARQPRPTLGLHEQLAAVRAALAMTVVAYGAYGG